MKTKLFISAIALFIFTNSFSQSLNFGLKVGANLGKISGKSFKEEFNFGYHIGGYVTIGLGEKLGLQPEVFFSQINTDTSSHFSSVYQFNHVDKIKLGYLSIPLILNYNVDKILTLQAGPQFGILIQQDKSILQNGKDAFKTGDFSILGGIQVKLLNFRVYGRYVIGLNDISNIGNSDTWKTQAIQLGVGIPL